MEQTGLRSLRTIILRRLALLGVLGVAAVCFLLPYALFHRDKAAIYDHAKEQAEMIRTGLLSTMMATGNPETVRATVDSFEKHARFDFRMVRSEQVVKQFGMLKGEEPRDKAEKAVLAGVEEEYASLEGTTFRLVFPFRADERCGNCHIGLDGAPVAPGTVLGISELVFDVTEWRDTSVGLTALVVGEMVMVMLLLAGALYWLFNKNVLEPVHTIANSLARMGHDETPPVLPQPESAEIAVLNRQVEHMFRALEEARHAHEKALERERRKMEQIRAFALRQADALGLTDTAEIDLIIQRLSHAVEEVEKNEMLQQVVDFVTLEKKELTLRNDIALIRPASLYLTDLIAGTRGSLKKGSVELALEEAITNAIIHGNLEVPSKLKEEDFELFEQAVRDRRTEAPFAARSVKITYDYNGQQAIFRIEDQGPGFDWSHFLKKEVDANLIPHGRGIIIIRTFASSITYNDAGNVMTITFDLQA